MVPLSHLSLHPPVLMLHEATETLSEVLTVLELVFDGSFKVEGFDEGCLMQNQRVAHTVDIDALSRHPHTQLWCEDKTRRSKRLL